MHEIELKPSPRLGLLLAGMLLLVLAAVTLAALPGGLQMALGAAATGLSAWGWWRAFPMASLRIAADGRLQCLGDTAEWGEVEILGGSFVSSALIVMRFRTADQHARTLTLLPDSADADSLRRLRVSLRWTSRTRSDIASPDAG